MKLKMIVFLCAFHFLMLGLGMAAVFLPRPYFYQAQILYARLTGAGGSFGFFSPNVPNEMKVDFDVEEADGHVTSSNLLDGADPEVRIRLGNTIRLIAKTYENEQVVRSVAASLTASIYRQHPDARSVTLKVFLNKFPSIEQFREGKRPEFIPIYSAKFERAGA